MQIWVYFCMRSSWKTACENIFLHVGLLNSTHEKISLTSSQFYFPSIFPYSPLQFFFTTPPLSPSTDIYLYHLFLSSPPPCRSRRCRAMDGPAARRSGASGGGQRWATSPPHTDPVQGVLPCKDPVPVMMASAGGGRYGADNDCGCWGRWMRRWRRLRAADDGGGGGSDVVSTVGVLGRHGPGALTMGGGLRRRGRIRVTTAAG